MTQAELRRQTDPRPAKIYFFNYEISNDVKYILNNVKYIKIILNTY